MADESTADDGHRHLADGLARQRGSEALAHAAVAVLIAGIATSTRAAVVTGACVIRGVGRRRRGRDR
jgi:hypothetical protein